ncbi:hypothetical protein MTBUT4_380010 [Magnetospirillum sp. UT-4]|nr:hypothetical protein MTBUT4_380010 [Magnetospirillum sp. UT-4]
MASPMSQRVTNGACRVSRNVTLSLHHNLMEFRFHVRICPVACAGCVQAPSHLSRPSR